MLGSVFTSTLVDRPRIGRRMSMNAIGSSLLSRLLDEHGGALVLYAQQWCNGPEDVVQEAFIRLMR